MANDRHWLTVLPGRLAVPAFFLAQAVTLAAILTTILTIAVPPTATAQSKAQPAKVENPGNPWSMPQPLKSMRDPRPLTAGSKAAKTGVRTASESANVTARKPRHGGPLRLYRDNTPTAKKADADTKSTLDKPPSGSTAKRKTVQISRLDAVSAASLGLLDAGKGGFQPDMWAGTRSRLVERLLPMLPAISESPAVRAILRALLLSTAGAPDGAEQDITLLAMRGEKLIEAGRYQDVLDLLAQIPYAEDDVALHRVKLDALLLAGDREDACRLAGNLPKGKKVEVELQKILIFCHALAGEFEQVEVGEDLLREQNVTDPNFTSLLRLLVNADAQQPKSLKQLSPLHLAMVGASKLFFPADLITSGNPAIWRAIMESAQADDNQRLEAALAASATGLTSHERVRELFDAYVFDQVLLDGAADKAILDALTPAMRIALSYRRAALAPLPVDKAARLSEIFAAARRTGNYLNVVSINLPTLKQLHPTDGLASFAGDAVRAYLAVGDATAATAWYALIAERKDKSSRRDRRSVAPLITLVHEDRAKAETHLSQWWRGVAATADGDRYKRGALLAGLFEAFGLPVPDLLWRALLDAPRQERALGFSPGLRRALRDAATGERVGETVLLLLVGLGDNGHLNLQADDMALVIAALRRAGLPEHARALALQTALQWGL